MASLEKFPGIWALLAWGVQQTDKLLSSHSLLPSLVFTHFIDPYHTFAFQIQQMFSQRKFNKEDERNIKPPFVMVF